MLPILNGPLTLLGRGGVGGGVNSLPAVYAMMRFPFTQQQERRQLAAGTPLPELARLARPLSRGLLSPCDGGGV